MGMSASQSRLISLTARMSDTEYEAQQINQQRLVLSNKMNEVYNALYEMEVPTPPSKQDYVNYVFSGKSKGQTVTAKIGNGGNVEFSRKAQGPVIESKGNVSITTGLKVLLSESSDVVTKGNTDGYYVLTEGNNCKPLDDSCFDENGKLKEGIQLLKVNDKDGKAYFDTETVKDKTVDGHEVMDIETALAKYPDNENLATAIKAIENTDPKDKNGYSVIVNGDGTFSFCWTADLNGKDEQVNVYNVNPSGEYDDPIPAENISDIVFDSNGNVSSAKIDGNTITLSIASDVDELAYDKAMCNYASDKAEYDKEQNRLNKQTSIYQRQDKMLELKLTRLDSERNALKTELDAVKKVIQDSVDRGFKTFSG